MGCVGCCMGHLCSISAVGPGAGSCLRSSWERVCRELLGEHRHVVSYMASRDEEATSRRAAVAKRGFGAS